MANWSNYKIYLVLTIPLILAIQSPTSKRQAKWGFVGHQKINRIAVFTLPPDLFGFYKEHLDFITDHAVDPDKRRYAVVGEAPKHYIDIDHYGSDSIDPFELIPQRWSDAVIKFSEDTLLAYGIVPWHIQKMKFQLQQAFENKNVDLILKYSADIGHYIADAHVPLHTTENYNGQLTNQYGIHGLWESRLVEINAENYNFWVGKSTYIPHVESRIWEVVKQSHLCLDTVLRCELEASQIISSKLKYSYENRGKQTVKVYSSEFCKIYHDKLNGMVERRMQEAILMIGSIWYTSWVDAGQPDLNSILNKQVSSQLQNELDSLEVKYSLGNNKGRVCEH
jgi:hypothetical protein